MYNLFDKKGRSGIFLDQFCNKIFTKTRNSDFQIINDCKTPYINTLIAILVICV